MKKCNCETISFSSLGRKKILANFKRAKITSDAGALLLRQVDRRIGLNSLVKDSWTTSRFSYRRKKYQGGFGTAKFE